MDELKNIPKEAQAVFNTVALNEANLYLQEVRSFKHFNKGSSNEELPNTELKENTFMKAIIQKLDERNQYIIDKVFDDRKIHQTYKLKSRLRIGIGGVPFKVPIICLHFTYGIPYIPASALKGALRHCWICEEYDGAEKKAMKDGEFISIFGNDGNDKNAKQGGLVFLDTYALEFTIGNDIQTPHFKGYYDSKGKELPTDTMEPNVLAFRCLSEAKFNFCLGFKNQDLYCLYKEKVANMLDLLCTQYGIGAKTSIGYGIMHKEEKGN